MPQRIRLQRAVVNETHYSDPEHENHLYHEHVEVRRAADPTGAALSAPGVFFGAVLCCPGACQRALTAPLALQISGNELFFDLIFVGIGIELSAFLKQEVCAPLPPQP